MTKHNFRTVKFYKKVWGAFSSPILNAQNYANYVIATNITDIYKLFDGNTSTYVGLGLSTPVYYVNMKFPNEIDVTNFVLSAQRYNPSWPPSAVKFYAKTDGAWSYLGGFDKGSIAWEGGLNMPYSLDNRIVSKELRIELGGGTLVGGGISYPAYALELSFTGQQITSTVEITETEYEANKSNSNYFKVEQSKLKNMLVSKKKYMKLIDNTVISDFTQPVLTSNGTLGGNSFAVACSEVNTAHGWVNNIAACFDGKTDTGYISNANGIYLPATSEIIIYNPVPLNIKKFTLSQGPANSYGGLHAGTIYGSDNGINWLKVGTYSGLTANASTITEYINLPNNTGYYKYTKIANTTGGTHGVVVKEITLTATQKTGTVKLSEVTKAEFDQLPDTQKYIENVFLIPTKKGNYIAKVA